jgi:hypothetical protein
MAVDTSGPAWSTTAANQGGATLFDRIKGLTESLQRTETLLAGVRWPRPVTPAKAPRLCGLCLKHGTEPDTAST